MSAHSLTVDMLLVSFANNPSDILGRPAFFG